MKIVVKKAGLHDTFQDFGRKGFKHYGIPQSGAMDIWSHQFANWLVGNPLNIPSIEITFLGGTYQFSKKTIIGLAGGDISPTINGRSISLFNSHSINKNDVLHIGRIKKGARVYLAIQGKPSFPSTFDSFSTYTYGKFGGFNGRILKKDDIIDWQSNNSSFEKKSIPDHLKPIFQEKTIIRIVKSVEWDVLESESQKDLSQQFFHITNDSNRMGIRLNGQSLLKKDREKMISSGTNLGTIQLLPNGQLIVLMNDGQTTGGYPRIANVIQADLGRLAQVPPNSKIQFKIVDLNDAQRVLLYKTEQLKYFLT